MFVVYELCVVSHVKHCMGREENIALFQTLIIKITNYLLMYPKNQVKGIDEHLFTCMTIKPPLICLRWIKPLTKNNSRKKLSDRMLLPFFNP